MKSTLTILAVLGAFTFHCKAQENKAQPTNAPKWTEADRAYLLENLNRSKEALIRETKNLSEEQWNFKESEDRWSINQIVEHLALYELIFLNDVSVALQIGPFPQIDKYAPDSFFLNQDSEDRKQNETTDYTKPFSYTVPLGINPGVNNLIWYTNMLEQAIDFVTSETRNLRVYYVNFGPNVHQKCMMMFTHANRHLQQIKKVKAHADYPK